MTILPPQDTPAVTVVLIVHNDAKRLPTAVRSVLRQTLRNLEVVIVDDGSTDQTPEVVSRLLCRRRTGSLGAAVDQLAGLRQARATPGWRTPGPPILMFLDSDDRYERHACKNLLEALEDADADFSMGLVRRYHTEKRVHTTWYPPLFDERRVVHGIAEDTELSGHPVGQQALSSGLSRRDRPPLPRRPALRGPAVHLQAYHRALRIAVIPEHVYTWRVFTSRGTMATPSPISAIRRPTPGPGWRSTGASTTTSTVTAQPNCCT